MTDNYILKSSIIETPIGPIFSISDEGALYFLGFRENTKIPNIIPGRTKITELISHELDSYFCGKLKEFKTPIKIIGTDFQKKVWGALADIPYGTTLSYQNQAKSINKPKSFRAVANANGANNLSIIIPCHRVINSNGYIGGYNGGVARKEYLINLEKSNI